MAAPPSDDFYIRVSNIVVDDATYLDLTVLETGGDGVYEYIAASATSSVAPAGGVLASLYNHTFNSVYWGVASLPTLTITLQYSLPAYFDVSYFAYIRQGRHLSLATQITSCDVEYSDDDVSWVLIHSGSVTKSTTDNTASDWTLLSPTGAVTEFIDESASTSEDLFDNEMLVEQLCSASELYEFPALGKAMYEAAQASGVVSALGLLQSLSETSSADAVIVSSVVQWFYETISASESTTTQATTTLSYAEQVVAAETLVALFNQLVSESTTGSDSWFVETAAMILDVVQASGIYASNAVLVQALAEAIVAIELQQTGGLEMISESAEADEALTNLLRATQAVLEQVIAADVQTSYLLLVNAVSEGVSADETVSIWQRLTQSIEEGGSAFVHVTFNGEVYTGWVMNTSNTAVSEYQGLNFNSLCKIGNRYFGATSAGIAELTGAQDSGVDVATYIQSGLLDFGSTQQKAVPDAYLAVDANGRVALGVSVSEKTQVSTYWYEANRDLEAINNVKVPIGKGLKGRYWKLEIASDAVSEFDAVTVLPVVLARRV